MHLPTKIFGYEPAAIAALVEGVLPALVLLHVWFLTQTQVGLIAAAVAALTTLYVALATQHATLTVVLGALRAGVALVAGYGFTMSPKDTAIIVAVAGVLFHFFNRDRTSPKGLLPAAEPAHPIGWAEPVAPTFVTPAGYSAVEGDASCPTVTEPAAVRPAKKAKTSSTLRKKPTL